MIGNQQVARLLHSDPDPGAEGGPISATSAAIIALTRGRGALLDAGMRASMESRFGADFEEVRVHTDADAAALNERLSSNAFTTGSDIYLHRNASLSDSRLLAHELAHVVQQRNMTIASSDINVGPAGDAYEQEAEAIASSAINPPVTRD